ncbi:Ig-like domain-containing protein [Shewanella nanhaiensis]|uniref:Ig-like domain-containing protein n=1 Tax=Shewanella nanhaiensis TaxID=2864872 RepID=A0ABS7E1K2_9GAMM|nr:Ig-like domain-containing protein [Shewanella nanhaiensis]MBW8183499.1 Ig-like domain-containing protein [Shewanella nanhaiensis]
MSMFKSIYSFSFLLLLSFLSGCGGDNDGFPTGGCGCGGDGDPCPPYAVELSVTPQLSTLAVATDEQYIARATYSDGTQREVTTEVIWSSSIPDVALIEAGGVASAETKGTTEIIATLAASQAGPEVSDSGTLHVTDAAVTSLTIEPGQAETLVGLTQDFKALALFADSHIQDVTRYTNWRTSEPSVATISNAPLSIGLATGVKSGTTQVIGSYANMDAQAQLVVLDSAVEKLVISPVDISFPVGTGVQYRADLIFVDGLSMDVTAQSNWLSSDASVASMNSDARLTGLKTGETQVSASLSFADVSVSDSTSATVTQSVVTQILVSPDNLFKPVGTQGDYLARAYYSDGTTADITHDAIWSVDDNSIAVIVESGEKGGHATAISPGTVEVTASFENQSGAVTAEVTRAVIESIDITPLDYVTPAGTQVNYSARARFSDSSVHDITLLGYWQSTDESVANIGSSGALAGAADAKTVGVTEISIDYMGLKQTTTLTVTDATISSLQVTPKNLQKPQGTRGQYRAIANYTDGHTQDVTSTATWSSANPGIVSIITSGSRGGYATANAVGETSIQAVYAGFKASPTNTSIMKVSSQTLATSSDSTSARVTNAVLEKLVLSPLTASIPAGNNQQYNLTGIFSDGSSKEVAEFANWQVESLNIASIDDKGNALGLSSGKTGILATYLGVQARAELIVTDAVIESLQVTPVHNQLPEGEKQQLIATAFYSDGHASNVTQLATWSSVDSGIVEVVSLGVEAGLSHALSAGETSITANFDGLQASATFVVTDAILESVTLSPIYSSIAAGNSQQYQFMGIFSDGTKRNLTKLANWQSSSSSVASVDRFGLALSYVEGMTEVSANYSGFSATATLEVTDASLTGLQVTPANSQVPVGTSGQFVATAFYSDGHSSDVSHLATWRAVDSSMVNIIATGLTGGLAEAVAVGETQVQARFEALTDSVDVTVTDAVLERYVVSPVSATIAAGLTQSYQATGIFSDGSNKELTQFSTWQSSDTSVATLDMQGVAKSYTSGAITVTASYIGFSDSASLIVGDKALSYIKVTPSLVEVPLGTEGQFTAQAFYTDKSSEDITEVATWRSQDESIVHIGTGALDAGYGIGVGVGQTSITAQYKTETDTAVVRVNDAEIIELTISPENKTVPLGLSQPYQAFARFTDGSSKEVTLASSWQSSNLKAATIDMQGLAQTTIGGGEYQTVIQATYQGLTAETNLYVGEAQLVEIQVTPATAEVNINEFQQYIATAFFSDGYSADISGAATWTVLDTSIAHVVSSGFTAGRVTGDTQGSTRVNAHYYGMDAQAEIVVTELEYLGVDVEPADSHVIVNETIQMQALAVYEDSRGMIVRKDVTDQSIWSIEKREKISINTTGLVTGLEVGESAVYAEFQGHRGEGRVNVLNSKVISLEVTPDNLVVPIGTKGRYTATAIMYNASRLDVTNKATWSSSNPDVIHMVTTGADGGTATATGVGSSTITAEYDGAIDSVVTQVNAVSLVKLKITPRLEWITAQVATPFFATATFSDGSELDVTRDASWMSNKPREVEIDTGDEHAGVAVGQYEGGSAIISASYKGLSDQLALDVVPREAVSIEILPNQMTIEVGSYQIVEVWVHFNDGSSENYADYVDWNSSDKNVASPFRHEIDGIGVGTAVVTASYDGQSGTAHVEVVPAS